MVKEISIDKEKCIQCGQCVDACPFHCITLEEYPVISNSCRLCGACARSCPVEAILIDLEEEKATMSDLQQFKNVLVFAEQRRGKLMDVSLELLGKGRKIADSLGQDHNLDAVLVGNKINDLTKKLISYGADRVFTYDHPKYQDYTVENYTAAIVDLIREIKPNILLIGATDIGRSLGPRIAAKLKTGLTADCTMLSVEDNLLIQTRPAFGGNIMATITCPNARPQMATVRPKIMSKLSPDKDRVGTIIPRKAVANTCRTNIVNSYEHEGASFDISEAKIIVAGGKGLGKKEGFELLQEFADVLGGVVGASRPCVEESWISYPHQIGLSGTTVQPKLYFACGISGATQHLAGIRNAETIVAINTDEEAPIFKVADYGLVGDLYEIIPQLIKKIKKEKIQGQENVGSMVSN